MKQFQRAAGWAIILGAILNLTRMVPVMVGRTNLAPQFPLKSAEDIAAFVSGNYAGHAISHNMALVSFLLFIFGILFLYEISKLSILLAKIFTLVGIFAFLMFTIAVLIDGWVMPDAVREYLTNPANEVLGFLVNFTHDFALIFYTVAVFCIFLFIATLSAASLRINLFSRWFCWSGMIMGDFAILLYLWHEL